MLRCSVFYSKDMFERIELRAKHDLNYSKVTANYSFFFLLSIRFDSFGLNVVQFRCLPYFCM